MRSLKDELTSIRESWTEGGLGDDVKGALLAHRQREFLLLTIFGVLMVACLGTATTLLVWYGSQTAKAFSGLAGLGGGGFLALLLRAWRDWSRTDLLLILVDQATRAQTAALIDKLIRGL
jgi:hypothetical protein